MTRIDVSCQEAKNAFYGFIKHAPDPRADRYCCLDAIYAAECGLAAIIMKERKKSNTTDLSPGKSLKPHCLHSLLELCGRRYSHHLPQRILIIKNATSGRTSTSFQLFDFHSALRYGATIDRANLKDYAECINKLCQWIKTVLETS